MKITQNFLAVVVCVSLFASLYAEDQAAVKEAAALIESSKPAQEQPQVIPAVAEAKETVAAPAAQATGSKRELIDKIVVRVNGDNLLHSELQLPRIAKEGGSYTIEEAISERLLHQQAAEKHMLPSAEDINRQLVAFKIQNNMTSMSDQEFEDQLRQHGFTIKTYKQQLGNMVAVENVKRAEMSEKIVVTTQDVQGYYEKNPEYTTEEYHLKICSIPVDKKVAAAEVATDKSLTWEDLGWIAREDIGKKFEVVFSMDKNTYSEPVKLDEKTNQIIHLLDKKERRLKTMDERYSEIERELQQERKEKFVEKFEEELRGKATIVYL